MSLSPNERDQFEQLTAGLKFDASDLREMARRERVTTMQFTPLPRFSKLIRSLKALPSETIALVMILTGYATIPISGFFLWNGNIKGALISVLIGGLIVTVADVADTRAKKNINRR